MSHVAINSNTLTAEGGWGTIGTGESEWAGNTPTGLGRPHDHSHAHIQREYSSHIHKDPRVPLFSLIPLLRLPLPFSWHLARSVSSHNEPFQSEKAVEC